MLLYGPSFNPTISLLLFVSRSFNTKKNKDNKRFKYVFYENARDVLFIFF